MVLERKQFGDILSGSDGNNNDGGSGKDAAAVGGLIADGLAGSGSAQGWIAGDADGDGRMSFLEAMQRISIGSRKQ